MSPQSDEFDAYSDVTYIQTEWDPQDAAAGGGPGRPAGPGRRARDAAGLRAGLIFAAVAAPQRSAQKPLEDCRTNR